MRQVMNIGLDRHLRALPVRCGQVSMKSSAVPLESPVGGPVRGLRGIAALLQAVAAMGGAGGTGMAGRYRRRAR
jgi:hypothetical protein